VAIAKRWRVLPQPCGATPYVTTFRTSATYDGTYAYGCSDIWWRSHHQNKNTERSDVRASPKHTHTCSVTRRLSTTGVSTDCIAEDTHVCQRTSATFERVDQCFARVDPPVDTHDSEAIMLCMDVWVVPAFSEMIRMHLPIHYGSIHTASWQGATCLIPLPKLYLALESHTSKPAP
jgi:hypothetical protein